MMNGYVTKRVVFLSPVSGLKAFQQSLKKWIRTSCRYVNGSDKS
jgi:hypothetical protein